MTSDYTVVSSKNNAILSRHKNNSLCYRVQFKISHNGNSAIDAKQHITFDTYDEILRLNDDMLDDIKLEAIPGEPNSRYLMMQIKPIGQGLGISGKYVVSKINLIHPPDKNCAGLVGVSVPLSETKTFSPNATYEELICENSSLFAFWSHSDASMVVQYDFTLVDPTFQKHGLSVPKAVSDMSALIIKKLFLRMKEYKERQINSSSRE
jgi:hypothetical protein